MGIDPTKVEAQQVIGVDLGGTTIKLGRFDRQGRCFQSFKVPTPQPPQPEQVLQVMADAIAQLDPDRQSLAIGVGTPGPADVTGRIARVAINLGWKDVPLADWLEAKTGKPTVLANDANCAGLGEYWLGAGQPFQDLIMLTLGTGVGGAVVLDGKLFVGRHGTAGELGLITLDFAGVECNSGNRGSLEQHVSVQAIRRRTGLEPEVLGRKAKEGDPAAIAFWKTYGCELGAGLASLVYILTPEAIIIGGGVSASAEFFIPAAQAALEQRVLPSSRSGLQLLPATLGNDAGIVGAAKLAWQMVDTLYPDLIGSDLPTVEPESISLGTQLQQTQLAYQMAAEMGQFKAGFLARTSHELRSPLNSIISLHQLILSDLCDSPEEEREFIVQAHASAQTMLRLLDELIRVSKAAHGIAQLQIQPLPLRSVLKEMQQLTYLQAQNRSLRLQVELPDPDIYVLADPGWLRQVLLNLVDTPLSLMQEGTVRVTTQVAPESQQVHFWVDDERPATVWSEAIDLLHLLEPEAAPEQELEMVRRAIATAPAQSSTRHPMSSGLVILISQMLLEQMNGSLSVITIPSVTGGTPSTLTRIQCSLPLVVPES